MKAVYITEHGGTDVLTYGNISEPKTGPNEVKVRVRACALNRVDVFTRMGIRGTRLKLSDPHILGGDAAGDIVDVGEAVVGIRPGERVVVNPRITCGQCPDCVTGNEEICPKSGRLGSTTDGSYAEYITVPESNTVVLPDSISYAKAACLPTVFMPSWSILVRRASLKPTETVLVLSASGGVGTAAIQIAKNVVGATVITTTSTDEKARMAKDLGADETINYTNEKIEDKVKELTDGRGVDVVVDHVGSDFWPAAFSSLAPGGRYGICGVTTGYTADLQMGLLFLRNQTVFGVYMGRHDDLRKIVELAGKGVLQPVVDQTFPLEDVASAHKLMEQRTFFGKLVLSIP